MGILKIFLINGPPLNKAIGWLVENYILPLLIS